MRISIITCTKNSMATLRQTVASIQAQLGASYECIFVDGESTDGTLAYLESLPLKCKILRGVGGGIAAAMNAGAKSADGDVLCHLHSDDYFLHPNVLSRVAKYFDNLPIDWLFGRILSDMDGALIPEQFKVPVYSYERLVQGNFIPHPATFIRTATFNKLGGFRTDLKFAMDYEFFLRLGREHQPLALSEALTVFRVHAGSTTVKNRMASFEEDHRVRLEYASHAPWERFMHAARYGVRKRRLMRLLGRESAGV